MLKDIRRQGEIGPAPSYSFYISDELRIVAKPIIPVDAILRLSGRNELHPPEPDRRRFNLPELYEITDHGINGWGAGNFIHLGKPSVGDVFYGDAKAKRFCTAGYLMEQWPEARAEIVDTPSLPTSDRTVLAELGMAWT